MPTFIVERVELSPLRPPMLVVIAAKQLAPEYVCAEAYIVGPDGTDEPRGTEYRAGERPVDEAFAVSLAREATRALLRDDIAALEPSERPDGIRFEPVDSTWLMAMRSLGHYQMLPRLSNRSSFDEVREYIRAHPRVRTDSAPV